MIVCLYARNCGHSGDGELSADDAAIIEELERSDPQKLNAYIQEALAWSLTSGTTPGKDGMSWSLANYQCIANVLD